MNKQEIIEKITPIIRAVVEQQALSNDISSIKLNDETNFFVDLGMDSIEIITMITEIENELDIEFDYDDMDIENITSFGNIVQSLENILNEKE